MLIVIVVVGFVLVLCGFIGRWLDRAGWLIWTCCWGYYAGTSPFVVSSLHEYVPEFCNKLTGEDEAAFSLPRIFCREASSATVALILSCTLGALSYPILIRQVQWVMNPLNEQVKQLAAPSLLCI